MAVVHQMQSFQTDINFRVGGEIERSDGGSLSVDQETWDEAKQVEDSLAKLEMGEKREAKLKADQEMLYGFKGQLRTGKSNDLKTNRTSSASVAGKFMGLGGDAKTSSSSDRTSKSHQDVDNETELKDTSHRTIDVGITRELKSSLDDTSHVESSAGGKGKMSFSQSVASKMNAKGLVDMNVRAGVSSASVTVIDGEGNTLLEKEALSSEAFGTLLDAEVVAVERTAQTAIGVAKKGMVESLAVLSDSSRMAVTDSSALGESGTLMMSHGARGISGRGISGGRGRLEPPSGEDGRKVAVEGKKERKNLFAGMGNNPK